MQSEFFISTVALIFIPWLGLRLRLTILSDSDGSCTSHVSCRIGPTPYLSYLLSDGSVLQLLVSGKVRHAQGQRLDRFEVRIKRKVREQKGRGKSPPSFLCF